VGKVAVGSPVGVVGEVLRAPLLRVGAVAANIPVGAVVVGAVGKVVLALLRRVGEGLRALHLRDGTAAVSIPVGVVVAGAVGEGGRGILDTQPCLLLLVALFDGLRATALAPSPPPAFLPRPPVHQAPALLPPTALVGDRKDSRPCRSSWSRGLAKGASPPMLRIL